MQESGNSGGLMQHRLCRCRRNDCIRIPHAQHQCSSGVFLNRMKALDISRKVFMRISFPSTLLGFVLLSGLTANSLLAQDQTTAGVSSTPTSDASSTLPHKAPDPQRQAKRMARKLG